MNSKKLSSFIIRSIFNAGKLGFNAPKDKIDDYQLSKLKKVVKLAYETPYWRRVFDESRLKPSDIKTLDDFINKVPTTDRVTIEEFENELLRIEDKKHLLEGHTSGSTTGKPLNYHHHHLGTGIQNVVTIEKMYRVFGVKPTDEIMYLFPRESSTWRGEKSIQLFLPNAYFIDPRDLENNLDKLRSVNAIFCYAHLPAALFKKVGNDDLVRELTSNLKAMALSGDWVPDSEKDYLSSVTNASIINPLASIECPLSTIYCSKSNHHLVPDAYYSEIDDNGELILTWLTPMQGTRTLRYKTGDKVKRVDCDCGWTWDSIIVLGRTYDDELHKHFRRQDISEAVIKTKSLSDGLIIYDLGAEKLGNTINVYIKKGPNYFSGCEGDIKNEIIDNLSSSLVIDVLVKELNAYDIKVNVVDDIPEKLRSQFGKHKVRLSS